MMTSDTPLLRPDWRHSLVRAVWFCGVLLLGLSLIVLIARAGTSGAPTHTGADVSMAQSMCEVFATKRLRAPSTAKFVRASDKEAVINVDGSVTIHAAVDAQNGFGAMLRTPYVCTVMPEPERGTWRLVALDMAS